MQLHIKQTFTYLDSGCATSILAVQMPTATTNTVVKIMAAPAAIMYSMFAIKKSIVVSSPLLVVAIVVSFDATHTRMYKYQLEANHIRTANRLQLIPKLIPIA